MGVRLATDEDRRPLKCHATVGVGEGIYRCDLEGRHRVHHHWLPGRRAKITWKDEK